MLAFGAKAPAGARPKLATSSCLRLDLLQGLNGVAHIRIEPRAARLEMRTDRRSHPRVPELSDMFGDPRHRLVMALAGEEFADLVGHIDQTVRRHRRGLPAPRPRFRCGRDG